MVKKNAKGRSKHGSSFVMLEHWMMKSQAYRSLKPGPRALLLEIMRRYNGSNNGRIGLGLREAAAALAMSDRQAIARYFSELEEKGFIRATRRSGFNLKDPNSRTATEWALTQYPVGDALATKEFMSWVPEEKSRGRKAVPRRTENPAKGSVDRDESRTIGTENPPLSVANDGIAGTGNLATYSLPGRGGSSLRLASGKDQS